MTDVFKDGEETVGVRRKGGHLSLEILRELGDARVITIGGPRASRAVSELVWEPAQENAIQRDDFSTVWHAGHVSALLSNGQDVVAGTQTGGVWHLDLLIPIPGHRPHYREIYWATPLSDFWDTPDVSSLAFGPDGPRQVFVGCRGSSALFLLEFDIQEIELPAQLPPHIRRALQDMIRTLHEPELLRGGMEWRQSTTLPLPFLDRVNAIVTFANPRRIAVATGQGVWWSPIPQPATNLSGYNWQMAQGLPAAFYSGLAAGPSGSVAAAIWGDPNASGIYRGTFQDNALVFTKAQIAGINPDLMRRTSLASCEDHRSRVYAVAAGADDQILAVLSSSDGGATWSTRALPDKAAAGLQGSYNNCIAVSPQNPDLVVIGWLSGGPFWSKDGAQSWLHPHTQETNAHLHNDLHALYLGRNSFGPEPLYVGGDGGIVVTQDMGQTYESEFNRHLNNLQFYGAGTDLPASTYPAGSLTASSRYPGLLAGGTQDNGNVYRPPDTLRPGIPRQADAFWLQQVGGDGGINRFIDPLGVLLNFYNEEDGPKLRMARWNEQTKSFPDGPGAVIPADDSPGGVWPTSVEVVQRPAFKKNGQLMYAAIGSGPIVYGLFADPDAGNAKLVRLGTIGAVVSAITSIDGSTLLIGTETKLGSRQGRIFSFSSASGTATEHTLPAGRGSVKRLETFTPPVYHSLGSTIGIQAFALVGNRILRFDRTVWAATSSTWSTFTVDSQSSRLFAANDSDVFVSHDLGMTWVDASRGLPVRPHCSDLRIAADPSGGRDLWLATYGRSVWRATISLPLGSVELDWDLTKEVADILFGNIQDGGGVFRIGRRLVKVPPRPLIRDLVAALASEDLAHSMSPRSTTNARAIRRVAGALPVLGAEALNRLWGLLRRER